MVLQAGGRADLHENALAIRAVEGRLVAAAAAVVIRAAVLSVNSVPGMGKIHKIPFYSPLESFWKLPVAFITCVKSAALVHEVCLVAHIDGKQHGAFQSGYFPTHAHEYEQHGGHKCHAGHVND